MSSHVACSAAGTELMLAARRSGSTSCSRRFASATTGGPCPTSCLRVVAAGFPGRDPALHPDTRRRSRHHCLARQRPRRSGRLASSGRTVHGLAVPVGDALRGDGRSDVIEAHLPAGVPRVSQDRGHRPQRPPRIRPVPVPVPIGIGGRRARDPRVVQCPGDPRRRVPVQPLREHPRHHVSRLRVRLEPVRPPRARRSALCLSEQQASAEI